MRVLLLFAGFLAVILVFPVYAETAEEAMIRCSSLTSGEARLICFDAAARNAVAPRKSEEKGIVSPEDEKEIVPVEPVTFSDSTEHGEPETLSVVTPRTPLSLAWDLDQKDINDNFTLRSYRTNYLLPVVYNFRLNTMPSSPSQPSTTIYGGDLKKMEAHFQISLKTRLWSDILDTPADLWLGYTQRSYWQMYNSKWSSPFRETDYEPELIFTLPVQAGFPGVRLRMLGAGFVHQSNGRSDPLSRSWNRVYGMAAFERGNWDMMMRGWYRIRERASSDDNSDISKYMGYGDITINYRFDDYSIGLFGRLNVNTGYGAGQLDFTFPLSGYLRGYVRYFDGYGENLLDYNHHNRSLGIGVMLSDWKMR
ncbi:MAG: phospholipase A [Burkholderiales bacterium]|jgi:phospholipase A1|nr:phospholipase A [Burkholderiales bacterium]